jgi:hypothetical protein
MTGRVVCHSLLPVHTHCIVAKKGEMFPKSIFFRFYHKQNLADHNSSYNPLARNPLESKQLRHWAVAEEIKKITPLGKFRSRKDRENIMN